MRQVLQLQFGDLRKAGAVDETGRVEFVVLTEAVLPTGRQGQLGFRLMHWAPTVCGMRVKSASPRRLRRISPRR